MTNKELLILAAKACELRNHEFDEASGGMRELAVHGVPHCGYTGPIWNSLNDPGDALRLAVALGIRITPANGSKRDIVEALPDARAADGRAERHGDDPVAATCRAITRVAADIASQGLVR